MKISFFIYHLNNGGAERVMTTLANNFSKRGYEVQIYTISQSASFYKLTEQVEHIKLKESNNIIYKKIKSLGSLNELTKALKKNKPDVLISFIDKNNLIAILAGKLLGIPVIISERSNPEKYVHSRLQMYLFRLLYKRADRIVLQTHASRRSFERLSIQLPNSVVIENPLDETFFEPVQLSEKENIILSVGRLSEEKGHDILLHALIGTDLAQWKVIIVGDGVKKEEYEQFIQKNSLTGKVSLVGKKQNVIDYYNIAKIFILPSRFEGFPNVLVEALSRGCVPISSDCDYGPSEIIEPGSNGFLFDVEDVQKLRSIIQKTCDSKEISSLQKSAIQSVKKFQEESICKSWMDLINEVT